jgi:hypothetical protein
MAHPTSPDNQPKSGKVSTRAWALLAMVMAAAVIVGSWWVLTHPWWVPASTPYVTEIIRNENFTVPAKSHYQRSFNVAADITFTQLDGVFSVQDDSTETIRVYVMDDQNFAEWQNGNNNVRLYDSGEVNSGEFIFSLVVNKTYYVVFDNTYSANSKNVNATVLLYLL